MNTTKNCLKNSKGGYVVYIDMKEPLHIVIDGGGTKTIAILFRENGEILKGLRKEFAANVQLIEKAEQQNAVYQKIDALFRELCENEEWENVQSVTFTIPGFYLEDETLKQMLAKKVVRVLSDDKAAYMGAFCGQKGICVSAGTGAVVIVPFDEFESGYLDVAGWGTLDDDAGSGYYVGVLALRQLFRDCEKNEYCLLSKRLMSVLNVEIRDTIQLDIIERLYREKRMGRREIAQLSHLVQQCVLEGCPVSKRIYEDCAYRLAEFAYIAYMRAIKTGACPVALVGGLKRSGDCLIQPFKKYLASFSKQLIYTEPIFENYIGSVVLALHETGVPITQECQDKIKQSKDRIK